MTGPERAARPGGRDQQGPPRMRPTSPATLVVAGLAAAALAWVAIASYYGSVPRIPWLPPVTLFVLAVAEAVLARSTGARIAHRPGTVRVDPLAVARLVVLAKASALAGAIFTGGYAGVVVALLVLKQGNAYAAADTPAAIGGLVAAVALVAGGLLLERACRVPPSPEDEPPTGTGERPS